MTAPNIVNILPPHGTTAKVGDAIRFSLRDVDSPVDTLSLQLYRGEGRVFYRGGVLPEDLAGPPTFSFQALSGHPNMLADRTILGDGYLRISKSLAGQNQEAVYFMGGLEAPAEPDGPMMVEFSLRLNMSEVTVDGNDFTGVLVGLLIGNTGLTVKFFYNTGLNTRRMEVHSAELTAVTPPAPTYVASFDWDEGSALNTDGSNTYKLLWHPQRNLVRLYVRDPAATEDRVLVDGLVSDFPTVPVSEQRADQPWLFFGHGAYPSQTSISEWKDVFLYNNVVNPIHDGIIGGGHVTQFTTNNPVAFDGENLPNESHPGWLPLPESFGPLGGVVRISQAGLELHRADPTKSVGFYRVEPRVVSGQTIVDFRLSGQVFMQDEGVESTGMEVYVDDGVKQLRLSLLQDAQGTQYVGILIFPPAPEALTSYLGAQQSFDVERDYRLIFHPGVKAELLMLVDGDEGVEEVPIITLSYDGLPVSGLLPASELPGPGIGFLNNANAGRATSSLLLKKLRYITETLTTGWANFTSPTPSWQKFGAGDVVPSTTSVDTNFGADASIVESAGIVTVSGLSGMSMSSVGRYLQVLNGDHPGFYVIDTYINPSTVTILSSLASGADSGNPGIQWREVFDASFARMLDESITDNVYFEKEYVGSLQPDSGWVLEFQTRVISYELDPTSATYPAGGVNPIRASTGFMAQVLDGTYRAAVCFMDAGPPNGKIVLLLSRESEAENLMAVRAKDADVIGTYAVVDWTKFHIYRVEKTVGGKLCLFIDDVQTPVLELENRAFTYPPHPGGNPRVVIGHMESGIKTISDFKMIKFCQSDGFDVSCKQVLTESETLERFDTATNVIVEAGDV